MATSSTIPQPRVIVLCFDGTADQYSAANTNVIKLFGLLDKRRPLEQIVYYQPGVGTFINPGVVSSTLTWLAKKADEAIAWYLNEHIIEGYKFLMQNYREGDKICLFGFSRGAYTARVVAGFLAKIGLLPRDNDAQVPLAYDLFKRTDEAGHELAAGFKRTFCAPVIVDFLGVWDTVASVGFIRNRAPPLTFANSAVKVSRHALSLDERRARFQPSLFPREESQYATNREEFRSYDLASTPNGILPGDPEVFSPGSVGSEPTSEILMSPEPVIPPVLEVWFAGCHCDVGGGAVEDVAPYKLADIPLRWMVEQVMRSQCGIKFDDAALRRVGIDVSFVAPVAPTIPTVVEEPEADAGAAHSSPQESQTSLGNDDNGEYVVQDGKPRRVKERTWDREQDVETDINDQLKERPGWWLLEFLPMRFTWQEDDGKWKTKWGLNCGRGREIRGKSPNFHVSVRQRMAELDYKPRATWRGAERYVH